MASRLSFQNQRNKHQNKLNIKSRARNNTLRAQNRKVQNLETQNHHYIIYIFISLSTPHIFLLLYKWLTLNPTSVCFCHAFMLNCDWMFFGTARVLDWKPNAAIDETCPKLLFDYVKGVDVLLHFCRLKTYKTIIPLRLYISQMPACSAMQHPVWRLLLPQCVSMHRFCLLGAAPWNHRGTVDPQIWTVYFLSSLFIHLDCITLEHHSWTLWRRKQWVLEREWIKHDLITG